MIRKENLFENNKQTNEVLEQLFQIAKNIYPFGNEEGFIGENFAQKTFFNRNILKILKYSADSNLIIRTLTQFFPEGNSDYFADFNSNYTFFVIISILRSFKSKANTDDLDDFCFYLNFVEKWLDDLFGDHENINNLTAIIKDFSFFKFDLLKDSQLDFLIINLINSNKISLLLLSEKETLVLKTLLKELFLDLMSSNFFENSAEVSKNIRFFSLKVNYHSFKHSYIYKGYVCELKTMIKKLDRLSEIKNLQFNETSNSKSFKFSNLKAVICVQEFFEKSTEETEIKKGFDQRFFLSQEKDLHISPEYQINCIFFQRKIPDGLLSQFNLQGIMVIDALGEKDIILLAKLLNLTPIYNLHILKNFNASEKIIEIREIELIKTDDERIFLMIPAMNAFFYYNLMFYLPRETQLKNDLFEMIPFVLETVYDALMEEEFVLEKGSFEVCFLLFIVFKTYDLMKECEHQKNKKKIVNASFCIIKTFKDILENYGILENSEIIEILNRIIENFMVYLYDYRLFMTDIEEILLNKDFVNILKKSLIIFDEVKLFKFCNLKEYFNIEKTLKIDNLQGIIDQIFEDYDLEKIRKRTRSFRINKKQKKFESLKHAIKIIKEFIYLKFI